MAAIARILWDLPEDPSGNVQHIAEHGLTPGEVNDVLLGGNIEVRASNSSGLPITFGFTNTGKYIAVVFEIVELSPLAIYPVTAFEVEI